MWKFLTLNGGTLSISHILLENPFYLLIIISAAFDGCKDIEMGQKYFTVSHFLNLTETMSKC